MVAAKVLQICDTASESSYDSPCSSIRQDRSLDQEKCLASPTSLSVCTAKLSDCPERTVLSVSFGDVEIRKYRRILGDHPDVSVGPPISLDWDYNTCRRLSLDKYESCRKNRRHGSELIMSNTQRWIIVEHLTDSTHNDIEKCIHEVQKVQCERRKTASRHSNTKLVQSLKNLSLHFKKGKKRPPLCI